MSKNPSKNPVKPTIEIPPTTVNKEVCNCGERKEAKPTFNKLPYEKMIKNLVSQGMFRRTFAPSSIALLDFDILLTNKSIAGAPWAACIIKDLITINVESDLVETIGDVRTYMFFSIHHEVMHDLLMHSQRCGGRNHKIFNIAADIETHNVLKEMLEHCAKIEHTFGDISDRLNKTIFDKDIDLDNVEEEMGDDKKQKARICYSGAHKNKMAEEIYEDIIKGAKIESKKFKISFQDFMDYINGESCSLGDEGLDKENEKRGGEKKCGKCKKCKGEKNDDKDVKDVEIEIDDIILRNGRKISDTKIKLPAGYKVKLDKDGNPEVEVNGKKIKIVHINAFKHAIGNTTMNLKEMIKKIYKVKLDWKKITKDSLHSVLEDSVFMTWGKPRYCYFSSDTPYLPNTDIEEKFGTIAFLVDESGSMSDDEISQAADIIKQSKSYYKKILVIKHDTDVGWEKEFDEMSDGVLQEIMVRRKCDGTSHEDAFNHVVAYEKAHPESMISCIVCCTDMESDIPQCQHIVQKYPKIYIVKKQGVSRDNIQGKIIEID